MKNIWFRCINDTSKNKTYKMSKKLVTVIERPKEYDDLEFTYNIYCSTFDIYIRAYKEKDSETFLRTEQRLCEIALKLIAIINNNKEKFQPIKDFPLFQDICKLLYDFKNKIENNDMVLHFRKCINWIRRKW